MCGLTGSLGGKWFKDSATQQLCLSKMANAISHRGPDDAGYWVDHERQIALAHRRLSIIDLSPAGHQPMQSPSGQFLIVFNGEIYNHLSLRKDLLNSGYSPAWRGHSDTETLLACFDAWGIQTTIERAIGMFAIAVWNRQTNTLSLVRDRVGEKPLYYGWFGKGENSVFLFGSELKALRQHPAFAAEVDRDSLSLYLNHSYIPAPHTIYSGIKKLPAGCILTVSLTQQTPAISRYWSLAEVAEAGVSRQFAGSAEEAVSSLDDLLRDAISQQMMADVPLGAFLSGGIDSSTVVALMQAQSSSPIKTFSIGFNEADYNEAEQAAIVANHLGTEHTSLYITPEQAMAVIPSLAQIYDEPFADSSQIPTYLVSKLAKQYVTVSLSGDAGDELFCGYNRYKLTASMWGKLSLLPLPLRNILTKLLISVSPSAWNSIINKFDHLVPIKNKWANIGEKIHKGAGVLSSESSTELYSKLVSNWNNPADIVIGGGGLNSAPSTTISEFGVLSDVEKMMAMDISTYLADDILVKLDRAAMSSSLESRIPFLDHRVIEFAWRLPMRYKLHHGETKWILRQVLARYLPKAIFEKPKMGFSIPLDQWLRTSLRPWAEDLLNEAKLRNEGFFNPQQIRQKWDEHLSGKRNWQSQIWSILMFEAWLESTQSQMTTHAYARAMEKSI